jgi:hypothetical protein
MVVLRSDAFAFVGWTGIGVFGICHGMVAGGLGGAGIHGDLLVQEGFKTVADSFWDGD